MINALNPSYYCLFLNKEKSDILPVPTRKKIINQANGDIWVMVRSFFVLVRIRSSFRVRLSVKVRVMVRSFFVLVRIRSSFRVRLSVKVRVMVRLKLCVCVYVCYVPRCRTS
jgi:hypothetical protein